MTILLPIIVSREHIKVILAKSRGYSGSPPRSVPFCDHTVKFPVADSSFRHSLAIIIL